MARERGCRSAAGRRARKCRHPRGEGHSPRPAPRPSSSSSAPSLLLPRRRPGPSSAAPSPQRPPTATPSPSARWACLRLRHFNQRPQRVHDGHDGETEGCAAQRSSLQRVGMAAVDGQGKAVQGPGKAAKRQRKTTCLLPSDFEGFGGGCYHHRRRRCGCEVIRAIMLDDSPYLMGGLWRCHHRRGVGRDRAG